MLDTVVLSVLNFVDFSILQSKSVYPALVGKRSVELLLGITFLVNTSEVKGARDKLVCAIYHLFGEKFCLNTVKLKLGCASNPE